MGKAFSFLNKAPEPHQKIEQSIDTSGLKKELQKQEQWIKQLHNYNHEFQKYTEYLNESNTKHKKEILEQINNISAWVEYFNVSHLQTKKELNDLRASIRKSLRSDFEIYHKTLDEFFKLKFNEQAQKKEELKEQLFNEIREEIKRYSGNNQQKSTIINADNEKPVTNVMHYNAKIELTNPEKELLSLLFNENKPLTYENISKKMNKSVNTIRVYMNSLKSKKQIIDEFITPSGAKVFNIKNSELVKTLFNLR